MHTHTHLHLRTQISPPHLYSICIGDLLPSVTGCEIQGCLDKRLVHTRAVSLCVRVNVSMDAIYKAALHARSLSLCVSVHVSVDVWVRDTRPCVYV
jgi:hypothetical protein